MIILHGIHLNRYDGTLEGFYPGGFKWAAEHGWGGEVFNFRPVGGRCYGHVETLDRSIRIERLGAGPDDASIDDTLVVWTAPDPSPRRGRIVVGWYRNAVVHRERQQPRGCLARARTFRPPDANGPRVLSFHVDASQEDCRLLAPEERVLWIPPRRSGAKGIPGQSPIYFPELQPVFGPELARRIRHFIDTGTALPLAEAVDVAGPRPNGRRQPDPERRRAIELAAMRIVEDHFTALGYDVEDVSERNLGYDVVAVKGDARLCVEVKGRSGIGVSADFTFNEFEKIRLEQRGRFPDGSYRICIVTDALAEGAGPALHHFWHVSPTPVEKDRGVRAAWRRIDGDGVLELTPREAAQGTLR